MNVQARLGDEPMGDCSALPHRTLGAETSEPKNAWPGWQESVKSQRHGAEQMGLFETRVNERRDYVGRHGRSLCGAELMEVSDLSKLLRVDTEGPHAAFIGCGGSTLGAQETHRERIDIQEGINGMQPGYLNVARPVPRKEFAGNKAAMEAYWKEWTNLEKKETWDWDSLEEWDTVSARA